MGTVAFRIASKRNVRIGILFAIPALFAQSGFDVASIHPAREITREGRYRRIINTTPTGIRMEDATLLDCIEWAYGVRGYEVVGPEWIQSERFEIETRTPGPAGVEQLRRMLQALLADRFQLRLHHETRSVAIYALVPAKSGPKLRAAKAGTQDMLKLPGGGLRLEFHGTSVAQLADFLSTLAALDRPVRDRSGFSGVYDFTLDLHEVAGPWQSEAERLAAPSMTTVLQEQLGLKFEAMKDGVDVLAIDHVERPSAN